MSKTYELSYTAERIDEILKEVDEHTIYSDATTEEHGLMSATDKAKLDALQTAQQIDDALNAKVDKEGGKGLSTNDYTDAEKAKVASALQTETDPTVPSWAKQSAKPSYDYSEIDNTPDLSGFITKSVNDLTNYYLKSETYTKTEVAALIGAIQQFHYEIYATLPQAGQGNVLYLIGPTGSGSDKYEEYVYANNTWNKIGDTSIDLSGYVTTSVLNTALADYTTTSNLKVLLSNKADKVNNATNGNFAGLDANGNLTDSGKKASDFATASQGEKADNAILFVEQDKLTDQQRNTALANVSNQTANSTTGKIGYKVLDQTKTFAEQVTAENTIYEIRDVFDLNNGSVTIPSGCTLKFNGGLIKNCNIVFDDTKIKDANFYSCSFGGNIIIDDELYDEGYNKGNVDDNNILAWLINQAANNSTALHLSRDYRTNTLPYNNGTSYITQTFVYLYKKSFKIIGNGHTIYDNYHYSANNTRSYMYMIECNNVLIENLSYECTDNSPNLITNYDINGSFHSGGGVFMWMFGDSDNINVVGCKARYCAGFSFFGCSPLVSANGVIDDIRVGDGDQRVNGRDNFVVKGLTNSSFEIESYDVTYGLVICKGCNITADLIVRYASRSFHCDGCENVNANIKACFMTTPIIFLMKDAISYTDHTYATRVFTPCRNITASVIKLAEIDKHTSYKWGDVLCQISSYGTAENYTPGVIDQQFINREKYVTSGFNLNLLDELHQKYSYNSSISSYVDENGNSINLSQGASFDTYLHGQISPEETIDVYDNIIIHAIGYSVRLTTENKINRTTIVNSRLTTVLTKYNNNSSLSIQNSRIENLYNNGSDRISIGIDDKSKITGLVSNNVVINGNKYIDTVDNIITTESGNAVLITESGKAFVDMTDNITLTNTQITSVFQYLGDRRIIEFIFTNFTTSNKWITLSTGNSTITSIWRTNYQENLIVYPQDFVKLTFIKVSDYNNQNNTRYYSFFERYDSRKGHSLGSATLQALANTGQIVFYNETNKIAYKKALNLTSPTTDDWVDAWGYPVKLSRIGAVANAPSNLGTNHAGYFYYATDLSKYICWNGTAWVNLDGTALS